MQAPVRPLLSCTLTANQFGICCYPCFLGLALKLEARLKKYLGLGLIDKWAYEGIIRTQTHVILSPNPEIKIYNQCDLQSTMLIPKISRTNI